MTLQAYVATVFYEEFSTTCIIDRVSFGGGGEGGPKCSPPPPPKYQQLIN